MKDICAVIFDLDDTLLRSDKSISDYTLGVLKKCREHGIYTGVATARNEISAGSWAHAVYNDFSNFNSPAYKITAQLDNPELARRICNEVGGIETLNFRGEKWRRFASVGADKVSAIREVTKHLGIDISEVAAFGDDYNDIEMIKAVGMGVAMGNAIKEVLFWHHNTSLLFNHSFQNK